MAGLWRKNPNTREGKYPVLLRRDGTVPEWEWFVLGERDPAAPAALRAYATAAERLGYDPQYVADLRELADRWGYQLEHRQTTGGQLGNPDAPPHRTDNPDVLDFPKSLQEFVEGIRGRPSGGSV